MTVYEDMMAGTLKPAKGPATVIPRTRTRSAYQYHLLVDVRTGRVIKRRFGVSHGNHPPGTRWMTPASSAQAVARSSPTSLRLVRGALRELSKIRMSTTHPQFAADNSAEIGLILRDAAGLNQIRFEVNGVEVFLDEGESIIAGPTPDAEMQWKIVLTDDRAWSAPDNWDFRSITPERAEP